MKIGIVTLPLNYNYGGLLQAYALQTVLEKAGHTVEIVDIPYRKYGRGIRFKFIEYPKRLVKKLLGKFDKRIDYESYYYATYTAVCRETDKFIGAHIHRRLLDNRSEVSPSDYDCLVVGSDQIWRGAYIPNIEGAYLDFARDWDIRRISYAASLGVDFWEYTSEKTALCKELAQKFDAISVRESSGTKLLRDHLDVASVHVLDPTMLLTSEEYVANLGLKPAKSGAKLMAYILDGTPEKFRLIEEIAAEKGLEPVLGNSKVEDMTPGISLEERVQPPVESWLQALKDADIVITDSFHACVFSILFRKPFWVLGNPGRGMARIESLLADFHLDGRFIYDLSDFHNAQSLIDYEAVGKILAARRKDSFDFLKKALG